MITGDHPLTALAIARDLGLAERPDEVVTGVELERVGPARIGELLAKARVFARVSPHQKLDIVRSAQAAGHFVAVTGDGVNDAPALRAANIGVAMGRGGTDVAREAAALVITDDHFATITAGIEEGRVAYDNIRKIVYLLTSTGAAEMLVVALAVLAGLPLPLLPSQLLWLNLVTNGIQDVALGFERGEPGVLRRPPRPPHEALFDRLMVERTVIAATVMSGVGFLWYWGLLEQGYSEPGARNELLLLMVLFENFHLLNCRSEIVSAFRVPFRRSPVLLFGIASALLIHVAAMHFGLGQALLETAPVSAERWVVLGLLASTILVAMEAHKVYWRRRVRRNANGAATAGAGG
jgi:magnesium-transporting ATPase (P-type)